MYFCDVITLRAVTITLDSFGDSVKSYTDTEVFANKKSVTRSEFFSATSAGTKIDAVFEVRTEDFDNQTAVTYGTVNYEIIRAYQKDGKTVELSCAVREVV
jgi:SPP1 family predicted phage head-tail adaptor